MSDLMATAPLHDEAPPPKPRRSRGRRIARWTGFSALALVVVLLGATAFIAYAYTPDGVDHRSPYLSTVSSQYVETDLAKFHYTKTGSGSPVVLVHGGGEWLYTYRHQIPELAKSHTVYAVDLPGHGYTTLKKDGFVFDLPSMTQSLRSFMDAVGLAKADLVGHSWGGGWALRLAQESPERVGKLALIDASGFPVEDAPDWEVLEYPMVGEAMVNLMAESNARDLLEKSFHNKNLVTDDVVREVFGPGSQPIARSALVDLQRNLDWSVTEKDLGQTRVPTLVMWGDDDQFLNVSLADRFDQAMPNAEKKVLTGCGHSAHEDCPAQATPALVSFLAGS